MKTIYKYPLEIKDIRNIPIPEGAEFLSVIDQNNLPVAYFLVDPSRDPFPLEVVLIGSGHPLQEDYLESFLCLGTVSTHSGQFIQLVWHIFAKQSIAWWRHR